MDFHYCEQWGSGYALWNASIICICLLVLLSQTSVGFKDESQVESVNFTAPSPDDFALTYTKARASFKCCYILVVLIPYEKSRKQSLYIAHPISFLLSGSIYFLSLAGNPKYCQTVLLLYLTVITHSHLWYFNMHLYLFAQTPFLINTKLLLHVS